MHIVGLTGGIASGKSTVAKVFEEAAGLRVVDLDKIAHEVTAKGRWGHRRVVAAFGPSVLREDGCIDRAKLADIVFGDSALRSRLNRATHLPIAAALLLKLLRCWLTLTPVVVLDAPLLFETRLDRTLCSSTVCVWCREDQQLARMQGRDGCTAAHAKARVSAQMPLDEKRKRATLVIDSSGTREETLTRALDLANEYKRKGIRAWLWS